MFRSISIALAASLLAACGNSAEQPARTATGAAPPASSASASSAAAPAGAVDLVSGVSLGPVRIGMDRAQLDATGLPTKAGPLSDQVQVGPYVARMEGGRVATIHVDLKDLPGVRIGGKVFVAAGGTTLKTIAPSLPGCGQERANTGANVITCDDGKTQLVSGSESEDVSLFVNSPSHAAQVMERERRR